MGARQTPVLGKVLPLDLFARLSTTAITVVGKLLLAKLAAQLLLTVAADRNGENK